MTKRALSLFLAGTMAASVITGCGGNSNNEVAENTDNTANVEVSEDIEAGVIDMEEDPYSVGIQVVVLPGVEIADEEAIESAINEITLPAINCTVDLQYVWISEIANTTSLAVASNEKIDIVHVATVSPLSSMVGSDILLYLNENNLLQTHGQDLIELFGNTMDAGCVNGQQLAVPARTYIAARGGFFYNKTLANKINYEVPEEGTIDDIENFLYAVKDSGEDVIPYYVGSGTLNGMTWMMGLDGFGSDYSYGVVLDSTKDTTVVNLYETDEFKSYCQRLFKWRKDGIIQKDSTDTTPGTDYFQAQKLAGYFGTIIPSDLATLGAQTLNNGFELGYCALTPIRTSNSDITSFMWGIATNCERPDKAMDFLNFLYTNADVANLISSGIEGVNYTFAEGSDKIIIPNGSYIPAFYKGGNEKDMYIVSPAGEDYIDQCEAFKNATIESPIMGYMFDDSDFQTESSVISTVVQKYLPSLQNGIFDTEEDMLAYLDEFNRELKNAGIDDVIAANQEQMNNYLAAH